MDAPLSLLPASDPYDDYEALPMSSALIQPNGIVLRQPCMVNG